MKWPIVILSAMQAWGECTVRPLDVVPAAIDIQAETILEGLTALGQQSSVCFGISVNDGRLAATRVQWTKPALFRDLVAQPLIQVRGYQLRQSDRVLLISPLQRKKGSWLDTRVPRFRCARTTVQSAASLLSMELRTGKPELAEGAFAGSHAPGDTQDLVGPFDRHDMSVREILDLIVGTSKGGIWLASEKGNGSVNLESYPWLLLTYGEPLERNLARMRGAAERIRALFPGK